MCGDQPSNTSATISASGRMTRPEFTPYPPNSSALSAQESPGLEGTPCSYIRRRDPDNRHITQPRKRGFQIQPFHFPSQHLRLLIWKTRVKIAGLMKHFANHTVKNIPPPSEGAGPESPGPGRVFLGPSAVNPAGRDGGIA